MNRDELRLGRIYSDNQGRFRRIILFYDGSDGEHRVKYEKGYLGIGGSWRRFDSGDCTKQSFSKWARAVI